MHDPKICPVCGSKNIELKAKSGFTYVCCKDCEYDEGEDYDAAYPGERLTQKGKTKHTPYKRGGSQRTRR
ncbi:MAG: hypothetical protein Q8L34_07055 [Candidatus Woesearchaeota archaeon]|nr:hypothetical protein [Candidatus Woesearchaeota archaeon]